MRGRAMAANDNEQADPAVVVWTIGHGNLPLEQFVALLRQHQPPIATVVDVRSAPHSRFVPHFNRETLEAELPRSGIAYRFGGDFLGGRPSAPDLYRDREVPTGKADYLHLVDYPAVARTGPFRLGLQRLVGLAADQPTAIMCSESDPDKCHRHHLIAKALVDQGVAVIHLRHDGSASPATFASETAEQPRLF